jgi:hypothetical protein
MDASEFQERLKKISREGKINLNDDQIEKIANARTKGKKTIRRILLIFLIIFGGIGFMVYKMTTSPRFLNILYVTDASGKSKIWVHTHAYMRSSSKRGGSTYSFQSNTLHILDPLTSKEIQTIDLPKALFPYSQIHMLMHKGQVWIIKSHDSGEKSDDPAPALYRLNPESGAIESKTEDFIREHSELQAGIKELDYTSKGNFITIKTKDGLSFAYCLDSDKMMKNGEQYSMTSPFSGNYFILMNENFMSDSRRILNLIHPHTPGKTLMLKAYELDRKPETSDTSMVMDTLDKGKVFMDARILTQDGTHALILHRTEVGDDGEVMLTCIDASGKRLWTITKDQIPILATMNRKHKESFFLGPGQISSNANAIGKDGTFILSLDVAGVLALNMNSGAVKWVFTNPYDSR